MMTTYAVISVPALRAWIRDRLGPSDCGRCHGRRAYVCSACKGEGWRCCDMDHEHDCRSCHGTGFFKCPCTPTIEWDDIPRPLVRLCGVEVGAWDLLDKLATIRALVVNVRAERGSVIIAHHDACVAVTLAPPGSNEPQPTGVFDYPTDQMVLQLAG